MFSSDYTVAPKTLNEAYSAYTSVASSVLVAGSEGLKRQTGHYDLAIDLSNAGLNYIHDNGDEITIGAMTTLEDIERCSFFHSFGGGVIGTYISSIADTDLKKHATLGGILACKPPFSTLLPILLCLTVDVELYDKGCMSVRDYLSCPPMGELITRISITKGKLFAAYTDMRALFADEPYLTGAVSLQQDVWRIAVGGRPGIAAIAENASALLTEKGVSVRANAAHVAGKELDFGDYGTCSEQERRRMTVTMVRNLINTVWKGFSQQVADNKKH